MTIHYKTSGLVFCREDGMDSDRTFSVFTKDFGRLEVLGKAIRKIDAKLRGGMELFSVAQIEFIQGKHRKTLTDAVALQRFGNVAKNPESFRLAGHMMHLVDALVYDGQKDDRLTALLIETMDMVNTRQPRQLMYYYFFWKFMEVLGHGPQATSYETILAMPPKDQQALAQKSKEHQRHIFSIYARYE